MPRTLSAPARAFAQKLGLSPLPAKLQFTLVFRAPRQGEYQPPDYVLCVDSSQKQWCTYRQYNSAPRRIAPGKVQLPVEVTGYTIRGLGPGVDRERVRAWARWLLDR